VGKYSPAPSAVDDLCSFAILASLSNFSIEAIMAKKTTKKKTAATKTKAKASTKKVEYVELELDPIEAKAFELAHSSDKVCEELELAVSLAMSQAVRKIFKLHGIALSMPQAKKVAVFLFGD
jgi:hypothetical protein